MLFSGMQTPLSHKHCNVWVPGGITLRYVSGMQTPLSHKHCNVWVPGGITLRYVSIAPVSIRYACYVRAAMRAAMKI